MTRLLIAASVLALVVAACAAGSEGEAPDTTQASDDAVVAESSEQSESLTPAEDSGSDSPESATVTTEAPEREPGDLEPAESPVEASPLPETTEPPSEVVVPALSPLVGTAVDDLAVRLGIDSSDVVVVSFESVIWPDGSRGCPQPDMAYTQVQVDGARIVLKAKGTTYVYHSGGSHPPFLCESK